MDWQLVIEHKHFAADLRVDRLFINWANCLFLSSTATYMPAIGPIIFYVTVKNLLNTRTFAQVTTTDIATNSSSSELLPRLIMPGGAHSF